MTKPRRRITLGLLMLLVAIAAVGMRVFEQSRRVRVQFANNSATALENLRIELAGRVEQVPRVAPRTQIEIRLPYALDVPVRLSYEVPGGPRRSGRVVKAPGVMASGPGGTVIISHGQP